MNTNETKVTQSYEEQQNPPTVAAVAAATYYYAVLDENDIVIEVMSSPFPAPESYTNYILLDALDETLVGMKYDRDTQTFFEPPSIVCDTSNVSYNGTNKTLDVKLDEMDAAAAANTAAQHTHDNKAVLDSITAENVAAWNAGTGSTGGTAVDAYTKEESDAKYAAAGSSYTKEESDAKYALAGSTGATMTGAEILTALVAVDGENSGLDADTLDGKHATEFAAADHTHTGYADAVHTHSEYAAAEHAHTGYANAEHTHTASEVGAAAASHTHTASEVGAAAASHTHDGYAASNHTHTPSAIGAAAASHSHSEYAVSSHTHSGYAASGHTHSDYFAKSGGTISGETNFSGGLVRLKGVQTLFHSGNQIVMASNNLPTRICGSAITSTKSITVDSDRRLKEDVKPLDKQALVDFMKQVELVEYRYKDEKAGVKHIGVIAQQLLDINPTIAQYFVTQDERGYYAVDYAALSLLALLAVQ